jgi:hypothetical protein
LQRRSIENGSPTEVTVAKENEFRDAAEAAAPTAQQAQRRPYVAPVLEDLGDLCDVTLGMSAGVGESGGRKTKTGRGT